MRKIVAIGGGEIVTPDEISETRKIDKEIIKLSGKRYPKLLFIPTASRDSVVYCKNVLANFGTELGCDVEFLRLYSEKAPEVIENKILSTDIIYVGGGNTYAMMKRWRALGVDKLLAMAAAKGTIMSGLSAGSICWFRHGASSSRKQINPEAPMIRVSGLGWVNAVMCPHYHIEKDRRPYLKELMKKTTGVAFGVDDCCAIEIIDNEYRIISSEDSANAYLVYWEKDIFHEKMIPKTKTFTPLSSLGV